MKEQFTYNGHEYKKGDKIKIVSTYYSRKYGRVDEDDIGCIYTIVGLVEDGDERYIPQRLIEVEKTEDRAFIIQGDEIEPYVEPEREYLPLGYTFTPQQQEKLCKRYGKDIGNMTGIELLDLLSFHLDNILVEGLE